MQAGRWVRVAERACLTVFCAWLMWVPLPFGSVVERARLPLVIVPLALGVAASLLRLYSTRDRYNTAQPTTPWQIWGNGTLLFLLLGMLQLVPLSPSLLHALSPESLAIWNGASGVVSFVHVNSNILFPISIDPQLTAGELLRLGALFATFCVAALMIRTHTRRRVFACVLCAAAIFEALYGIREAALQRYEIWGWVNRLVFHRVTGTFVNPNHFAHYIAIILPMALFLGASLWRRSGDQDLPFPRRIALVLERHALLTGFVVLATIICLGAILLAQSRAALVAMAVGYLGVAAMLPGRRVARVILGAAMGLLLIVVLAYYLGPERTMTRFGEVQEDTSGRRIAMTAALEIWNRFSILGSGLGTFERAVALVHDEDIGHLYHHAHNDYAEIAATAGTAGLVIALVTLIGGYVWLVRMTFGEQAKELTWTRRAYQAAALASISVAVVHALFDFNLFISANPATLAAIAGAAVASTDHDKRTRRS